MIMPAITEVCINCTRDNCTYECHPVSGNNPFRINNVVSGINYTISLSLRNDFGQSGESAPKLYGEGKTVLLRYGVYGVYISEIKAKFIFTMQDKSTARLHQVVCTCQDAYRMCKTTESN